MKKSQLQLKVISDESAFYGLREDWVKLTSKDSKSNLFLDFEWLYSWWTTFATANDKLHIITVHNKSLIAIVPLYIKNDNTIRFLGTGEAEEEEVATEYLDVISISQDESILQHIVEHLLDMSQQLNCNIEFNNYLQSSRVSKVASYLSPFFFKQHQEVGLRYLVQLPCSHEAYLSMLSPSFAKKLKRNNRKLFNKLGGVFSKVSTHDELHSAFEKLIDLHQSRWSRKSKPGAFTSKKFNEFHTRYSKLMLENKRLSLFVLRSNNEILAVNYSIDFKNTRYFYQIGINDSFQPNISPGNLIHHEAIKHAIDNGMAAYDFMKGQVNNSYKNSFANHKEKMNNTLFVKRRFRNILCVVKWNSSLLKGKFTEWLAHFQNKQKDTPS